MFLVRRNLLGNPSIQALLSFCYSHMFHLSPARVACSKKCCLVETNHFCGFQCTEIIDSHAYFCVLSVILKKCGSIFEDKSHYVLIQIEPLQAANLPTSWFCLLAVFLMGSWNWSMTIFILYSCSPFTHVLPLLFWWLLHLCLKLFECVFVSVVYNCVCWWYCYWCWCWWRWWVRWFVFVSVRLLGRSDPNSEWPLPVFASSGWLLLLLLLLLLFHLVASLSVIATLVIAVPAVAVLLTLLVGVVSFLSLVLFIDYFFVVGGDVRAVCQHVRGVGGVGGFGSVAVSVALAQSRMSVVSVAVVVVVLVVVVMIMVVVVVSSWWSWAWWCMVVVVHGRGGDRGGRGGRGGRCG